MEYDKVIRSLLLSMAIVVIVALAAWAAVTSGHAVDTQVIREFTLFIGGSR
jgi:hypothetical protein